MGGIWATRNFFSDALIDIAGYKAGVVLTEVELLELVGIEGEIGRVLDPNGPGGGRISSTAFEEAVVLMLYKLGNTPSPSNNSITVELYHKYKKKSNLKLYELVLEEWINFVGTLHEAAESPAPIDPSEFLKTVYECFGSEGFSIGVELIEGLQRDIHRSAWSQIRNIEWRDQVELKGLFKDAGLETQHGKYFDQRYINYLGQNFNDLDRMHWRKFEGLTAEFFQREGFEVTLGPGSNDDGVDLRIFPKLGKPDLPPLILVQCKRQKEKIDKALIKSVYADVLHEEASSGLIVTSSTISPGAENTRVARNYPIEIADRATIRLWLDRLRSH